MFKKLSMLLALGAICAFGLVAENGNMPKKQKVSHYNKKHRDMESMNEDGSIRHDGVATVSTQRVGKHRGSCGDKFCGQETCSSCRHTERDCPPAPLCEKTILVPAQKHRNTYTEYSWSCPSDTKEAGQ